MYLHLLFASFAFTQRGHLELYLNNVLFDTLHSGFL
jgi:hypothetical protein